MPITEALKKLIKTITGKDAAGETIEELVQNLSDNYTNAVDDLVIFGNKESWSAEPFSYSNIVSKLRNGEQINIRAEYAWETPDGRSGIYFCFPKYIEAWTDTELRLVLGWHDSRGVTSPDEVVLGVSEDGDVYELPD